MKIIGDDPVTREALDRMIERGWVEQNDNGYRITDKGTQAWERLLSSISPQPHEDEQQGVING